MSRTPLPTVPATEDWSDRVSLTFTIGTYVALNAVRDLFLLIDAPDCAHLKTQYLQGNHDWLSTLTSTSGLHRVANTDLHPWKMVSARDERILAILQRMAEHPDVGAVLVTAMPMAAITGQDYVRLTRAVSAATGKPVAPIPGAVLDGDWLDGYAAVLATLAQALPLADARPRPEAVGVVGYLMDRNEGDHTANLAEIRRLLAGLGLRASSIWLGGDRVADLARIGESSLIVSWPYGRAAARILGERLQVPVLETDLPVGLAATERWLQQVATAAGVQDRLPAVLEQEFSRALPRLEVVVPYHLLHRRMMYVGDPHLGAGICELAEEVGLTVEQCVIPNRPGHARALTTRLGDRVLCDPKREALNSLLRARLDDGRCDLLVTNSTAWLPGATPIALVELGFPSFFTHALEDRPFLFARGAVVLVERFINALRAAELTSFRATDR